MILFFDTKNNGFDIDLGTGISDFDEFPCSVEGINYL